MDAQSFIEAGLLAFTTFFATVGPVDVAAIFATLMPGAKPDERRRVAVKGTAIAAIVLLAFAFFGTVILERLGIGLPALRTAGGILLLLIAIDMVFARHSGGASTTSDEEREAHGKDDISVFPLATPLIAGPGTMGAVILLMAETEGSTQAGAAVVAALIAVLALTLILLLLASQLQRFLGVTGTNVISRVIGVLLAALAVQFVFDGLGTSGLIG